MLIRQIRRLSLFRSSQIIERASSSGYPSASTTTNTVLSVSQQSGSTRGKRRLRPKVVVLEGKDSNIMSFFDDDEYEPDIAHGERVVDRKSIFQGHCAGIQRVEHVEIFLNKLKEIKKIENAFHNMWAYRIDKNDPKARIAGKSASIIQDCDDDGEQAAGGRLLTLLQILNVVNVMVVVTRWYGGIQLGPARFKHINNAARDSLVKGGFVREGPQGDDGVPNQSSSSKGKSSGKKKKK